MMVTSMITRQTCRVCDSPLTNIVSLGQQQLAGGFGNGAVTRKVPLELVRCDTDKHQDACGLVQLRHTVPPAVMYSSYFYRSGVNKTMTDNLHGIAKQALALPTLQPGDVLVDVGCNDGTLLDAYKNYAFRPVGFEPSDQGRYAEENGHEVIRDFFTYTAFRRHFGSVKKAKVITSIAMFYDLEDPVAFALDIASALHKEGVWILELHYLPAMLQANSFDAIVHEHLAYYSLAVLERITAQAGLEVLDASTNNINGGSIRLTVGHRGAHPLLPDAKQRLQALRVAEFELALDSPRPYLDFRHSVERVREQLNTMCRRLKTDGKVVHVYGASTKGNTILQFAKVGPDLVPFAADRNPDKYGTTTSTGIPIVSEDESRAMKPDFYLALPWHFLPEFTRREREFLERGGEFIVPLPHVHTVSNGRLE